MQTFEKRGKKAKDAYAFASTAQVNDNIFLIKTSGNAPSL